MELDKNRSFEKHDQMPGSNHKTPLQKKYIQYIYIFLVTQRELTSHDTHTQQ